MDDGLPFGFHKRSSDPKVDPPLVAVICCDYGRIRMRKWRSTPHLYLFKKVSVWIKTVKTVTGHWDIPSFNKAHKESKANTNTLLEIQAV